MITEKEICAELRKRTNAPLKLCLEAVKNSNLNIDKALEYLKNIDVNYKSTDKYVNRFFIKIEKFKDMDYYVCFVLKIKSENDMGINSELVGKYGDQIFDEYKKLQTMDMDEQLKQRLENIDIKKIDKSSPESNKEFLELVNNISEEIVNNNKALIETVEAKVQEIVNSISMALNEKAEMSEILSGHFHKDNCFVYMHSKLDGISCSKGFVCVIGSNENQEYHENDYKILLKELAVNIHCLYPCTGKIGKITKLETEKEIKAFLEDKGKEKLLNGGGNLEELFKKINPNIIVIAT